MAVYKQTYKTYEGRHTAAWSRFLILMRFSYARLFQSKFLILFLSFCMFYPLVCAIYIYIYHNALVRAMLNLYDPDAMVPIHGQFFYVFSVIQGSLAYFLTIFIGPNQVAPDLANGALPLYLSRPFSRVQYVAGKMTVLLCLLSAVTWVPGLLLYFIQAGCEGWAWARAQVWLAGAIFMGLGIWIVILSLIALALSAWVKWKIAAGALIMAVFFTGAGFGATINLIMQTHYGGLIDLMQMMRTVWSDLYRYDTGTQITAAQAWTVLGMTCLICLGLLAKRVKAFEVVK